MSDIASVVSAMEAASDSGATVEPKENATETTSEVESQEVKPEVESQESGSALAEAAEAEAKTRRARAAEAALAREQEVELQKKEEALGEREARLEALAKDGDVVAVLEELGYKTDVETLAELLYIQKMGDAAPEELKAKAGELKNMTRLQKMEAEVEALRREKEEARESEEAQAEYNEYCAEISKVGASAKPEEFEYVCFFRDSAGKEKADAQFRQVADMIYEETGETPTPEAVIYVTNEWMKESVSVWKDFFSKGSSEQESAKPEERPESKPASTITGKLSPSTPMVGTKELDSPDPETPDQELARVLSAMNEAQKEESG